MDKITTINDKIEKLRKQKIRVQTQEAILFKREAEKLFEKDFKPELALAILSDWKTATDVKKKEWTNKANSFRNLPLQKAQRKTETYNPAPHQNGKAPTAENG